MALLTADWISFGRDDFFRRFDIYDMEWASEISLELFTITCTRFGGPIATIRDKTKFVKIQGAGLPVITIYSTSGKNISSFVWNNGQMVQLGWSSNSDLLCVQEDGKVLVYDMFGERQYYFSMGREAENAKVIEAQVFLTSYGTGVAVLTQAHRLFLVNTVREKEARVRALPEPKDLGRPTAWLAFSQDSTSQVIYARERDLYLLTEGTAKAVPLRVDLGDENASITSLAISSDYEYLAIFTNRGKLWMGTLKIGLLKCLRLFDARNSLVPDQMMWCGRDAVVLNMNYNIEVVGLQDLQHIQYSYDCPVHLVQEVDCVRLITSCSQEILQKVPTVVRDIFRINSTAPGSYLLEASKQFQRKSHQANEYLHLVKPNLFLAIKQCIDAAGHEFKINIQEMLIKAAQFGKTFLDDFAPETYVSMVKILPCLNAVRDKKIGIPLTYCQYQTLSMSGLLDLLVCRRQHYLALTIAKFLKLSEDSVRILSEWACYKVKQNLNKDQIAREILEKLKDTKGVSYTAIAMKASDAGKTELAIKLIDFEPCASLQVPLLLKLGDHWTAMQKAIDSGNTDLVYIVLQHLKDNMPQQKFQMEVRKYPLAQALHLKYCRQYNPEGYKDILTQEDDHNALAECCVRDSFDKMNSNMREASLAASSEHYKKAKNDVYYNLCEEQLKLLKYQRRMEEKFRRDFVGKSLHDTVKLLLTMKEIKLADNLRSEYKVPDRRYWWLRVQVLGDLDDWIGLETFSKSKKSPIGYEPFLDVCLEKDQRLEAQKYLPKIKDEFKVKYLVKLRMMEEALQTAVQQNDLDALIYIQSKCDESLSNKVAAFIHQLSKK